MKRKIIIALLLLAILLSVVAAAEYSYINAQFQNSATIIVPAAPTPTPAPTPAATPVPIQPTVSLSFFDSSGAPLTKVEWGDIQVGVKYEKALTVKNTGTVALTLERPSDPGQIFPPGIMGQISWNLKNGQVIQPGESLPAVLSLQVLSADDSYSDQRIPWAHSFALTCWYQ